MKLNSLLSLIPAAVLSITLPGCATLECCPVNTQLVTIYKNHTIAANTGISTGTYTAVDGYRYANVAVEFEQTAANEEPVSLGVVFAHDAGGSMGSRRYFNFGENFSGSADPQMITISGEGSWHGHPHDKSSYTARLPIMGPYIQVFPFNHHDQPRNVSVVIYLTE